MLFVLGALISVPLLTPAVEAQALQCMKYTTHRPWGIFKFSYVETGVVRCSGPVPPKYRAVVGCYRHDALVHTVYGPWVKRGKYSRGECYPGLDARVSIQYG